MGIEIKEPLFSIVTVCYNSEKTIKRTIESVLKQPFLNYEYILVDGDSKDGTIDIVKSYESLFNGRLKWISEPDKGIYDAFNKGIARSKGLYIWIVNSDDYIEPDALLTLKEIIETFSEKKYPIISMGLNLIDENTGKILKKSFSSALQADHSYRMDDIGVTHPATLVPRFVYQQWGTFDDRYKLSGDCDWFHRVYEKHKCFFFSDKVITNMSNAGISNQWTMNRFKISYKDRSIYFSKFYPSFFERYTRFAIWIINILLIIMKKKIWK